MENNYLLWLEVIPVRQASDPAHRSGREYIWHTFSSFDEALLTLYTTPIHQLNPLSAEKQEQPYYIEAARIYDDPKGMPIVEIERYDKRLNPIVWSEKRNIDCTYAVFGSFENASTDIKKLFHKYLDTDSFGSAHMASYTAKSKHISDQNLDEKEKARAFLESRLLLNERFDYKKIEWRQGDAILYPPAATVTAVQRHPNFISALAQLLEDHITKTGRMPDNDPDITENFCCISKASNDRPVAEIMNVYKSSPTQPAFKEGMYLHFDDEEFMLSSHSRSKILQLLFEKPTTVVPLAISATGEYCDYVALRSTKQFINATKNNESIKHKNNRRIVREGQKANRKRR